MRERGFSVKKTVLKTAGAAAILICAGASQAADNTGIPKLAYSEFGWFPVSDDFESSKSGPGPVVSDPAHPYYNNQSDKQIGRAHV